MRTNGKKCVSILVLSMVWKGLDFRERRFIVVCSENVGPGKCWFID